MALIDQYFPFFRCISLMYSTNGLVLSRTNYLDLSNNDFWNESLLFSCRKPGSSFLLGTYKCKRFVQYLVSKNQSLLFQLTFHSCFSDPNAFCISDFVCFWYGSGTLFSIQELYVDNHFSLVIWLRNLTIFLFGR